MCFNIIRFAFCAILFTVLFSSTYATESCSIIINLRLVLAPYLSLSNCPLICDVYIQGVYTCTHVFPGVDNSFFPPQIIYTASYNKPTFNNL